MIIIVGGATDHLDTASCEQPITVGQVPLPELAKERVEMRKKLYCNEEHSLRPCFSGTKTVSNLFMFACEKVCSVVAVLLLQ